jgi:hypothetical protein
MCSALGHAQTIDIIDAQSEIADIVFNQKDHFNKKFKVKYKLSFGNKLAEKKLLKYRLIDDSTLIHNSGNSDAIIRIKDSVFVHIEAYQDPIPEWKLDFYSKEIIYTKNILSYYDGHNIQSDSIIYFQESTPRIADSLFLKQGFDSTTTALKILYNNINKDTLEIKRFLFNRGLWVPFFNFTVTKNTVFDDSKSTVTKDINGIQYGVNYSHWPRTDRTIRSKRISKYYYRNGIITRIMIYTYSTNNDQLVLDETIELKVTD